MNNSRRKRINQCIAELYEAQNELSLILEGEQNALAKVPEDDEYDEMREGMEEFVSGLEDTLTNLEDAINTLEGAYF